MHALDRKRHRGASATSKAASTADSTLEMDRHVADRVELGEAVRPSQPEVHAVGIDAGRDRTEGQEQDEPGDPDRERVPRMNALSHDSIVSFS